MARADCELAARGRWVAFEGERITAAGVTDPPSGAERLDGTLWPGFVDLQVNGLGDVEFATASADGWTRITQRLLGHGVTAFCPTYVTAPLDSYAAMLAAIPDLPQVLGPHLEGPFLGGAPGAHDTSLIREADPSFIATVDARIVTLAPEADPGLRATRGLADRGVLVAIGHSTASYDEARAAADAGARAVTHLFNGMNALHHREPGVAGAALDDDRLTPTLIADLVHVHPAALRLAIARKRNVALVSDAVGHEALDIPIVDGAPRLPDGTLAGSCLTLDRAVRNVVGLGVSLERAVEMATRVPADLVGAHDRGRIEPGARADLVLLDDALQVAGVWLGGERMR